MAILANCLRFSGKEPERRTRLALDSVDMLRRLGDRAALPYPLRTVAAVERERGNVPAAQAVFEEVISIVRDLGDPAPLRIALLELGGYESADGNLERSFELESEAVAIALELGDVVAVSDSRQNLACTLRLLGRVGRGGPGDAAGDPGRARLPGRAERGHPRGGLRRDPGRPGARPAGRTPVRVRRRGGTRRSGLPVSNVQADEFAAAIDGARARLPQAEWDAHYRAGYDAWVEDELAHALAVMTEGRDEPAGAAADEHA